MIIRRVLIAGALAAGLAAAQAQAAPDWAAVAKALGKAGSVQPGGIYKVPLPRTDLHVTLDGVPVKAGFALGSWVAFEPMGNGAMVMGDLVLTHAEVNPVISRLEQGGLEVTALHNHLLRSEPATMYLHVEGQGDPVKLAAALHAALSASGTPFAPPPAAREAAGPPPLDVAAIDRSIGLKGKFNGGVLQYGLPRREQVRVGGMAVSPTMGTATSINFEPLGGGRAAVTGDFVLLAREVNPVIRALRGHGIEITAVHNHMLDDEPRLFFMHYWGVGSARALAEGLAAAIAQTHLQHG